MITRHTRYLLKTLSWRILSLVITFFLAWYITGELKIGAAIGLIDFTIKSFLYYFHEIIWYKIKKKIKGKYYERT